MPGDKTRQIHPEGVPLDNEGSVNKGEPAAEHGDRRHGHERRHDAVADHAGDSGDDEDRLGGDLEQRPPAAAHSASRRTMRRAGTVVAMLEMPVAGDLDCDRLSCAIDRAHAGSGFDPADHRDRHAELRG
jgi:hypothetical protein